MPTQPRISIVGAGIAGLTTAFYLQRAGITASIYEAAGRIGGRVQSARGLLGEGLVTELGGEFINTEHKDMRKLARWFGLLLLDCEDPEEQDLRGAYYFGGRLCGDAEQVEAFRPLAERITKDRQQLSRAISARNYSPFDQSIDRMTLSEYLATSEMADWMRRLIANAYTTEYGLDPEEQSALNLVNMISTDTESAEIGLLGDAEGIERFKIQGGNDLLIRHLGQQVEAHLHTDFALESMETHREGFRLHLRHDGSSQVVDADIVVLALPFSTLRRVDLRIPLSPLQRDAIQHLRYGTNAKVIVGFQERIWRRHGYSGDFQVEGAQTGWDSSRRQPGIEGSLTFYLGGRKGREAGRGSAEERAAELSESLQPVFPAIQQTQNGRIVRKHWPSEPWALGSYACYGPGEHTRLLGAFARQSGNLLFAGEHISRRFQGYMNGGAETGRLAAERILRRVL